MKESTHKRSDLGQPTAHQSPKITKQHLEGKINKRETLGQFLSSKCRQVVTPSGRIYETANWNSLTFLTENRSINEAHVLALMDSFRRDGYLFSILYVNEKLEIIDGQHRFDAARRLKLPIHFMVMPGWGIREVIVLNVSSRNWSMHEFLVSYAKAGNQNYVRFKAFCDTHPFEITTSQILVLGRRTGRRGASDAFRMGKIEVSEGQIKEAKAKAALIADMQLYHPLGWTSRNFVEAMLKLFSLKNYNHEWMLERLEAHPDVLLAKARSLRKDEYLRLFVEKYNYRRGSGQIAISK